MKPKKIILFLIMTILMTLIVSGSDITATDIYRANTYLSQGETHNTSTFINSFQAFNYDKSNYAEYIQTYTSSSSTDHSIGKFFNRSYITTANITLSNIVSSTSSTGIDVYLDVYNGTDWVTITTLYSGSGNRPQITYTPTVNAYAEGIRVRFRHNRYTTISRTFTSRLHELVWQEASSIPFAGQLNLFGNNYRFLGNQSGFTFRDDTVYDSNYEYWGFECSHGAICDGNWGSFQQDSSSADISYTNISTPIFPKTLRVRVANSVGGDSRYGEYTIDPNCDFTNNVLRIRRGYTGSPFDALFQCYDSSNSLITLGTESGSNILFRTYGIVAKLDPADANKILDYYGSNDGTLNGYTFNDGTVSGGVTIEDSAMVFDGVDGVVTINDYDGNFRTNSLWFNNNGNDIIIGDSNLIQNLQITPSQNRVRAELTNSDNTVLKRFDITITLPLGANHILIMQNDDGSNNQIWVNGVKYYDDVGVTLTHRLLATYRFGRWNNNYYDTSIYSMNHFNRILTSSEITEIYNAGKHSYSPISDGLVAQYSGKDFEGTEAIPTSILDINHITQRTDNTTALNFDGVNDYVEITRTNELEPQDFTLAGWVKFSGTTKSFSRVIDKDYTNGYFIDISSSNVFRIVIKSIQQISHTVQVGEWFHFAATKNGEDLELFINNISVGTSTYVGNIPYSSQNLFISTNMANRAFNGSMSDVRIFNRALTADEIADLYNNPLSTAGMDSLVSYYPLQAPMFNKIQRTSLADITVGSNYYFSRTYTEHNLSSTLDAELHQGKLNFQARSKIYNQIVPGNITISNVVKPTTDTWQVSGNYIFATWSADGWYNQTQIFKLDPQTTSLTTFTDVYNAQLNISAKNNITSEILSGYNVTITNGFYTETQEVTGTNTIFNLIADTYTITIHKSGYADNEFTLNITEGHTDFEANLYTKNSLLVNIYDIETGNLVTNETMVQLELGDQIIELNTSTGSVFKDDLAPGQYFVYVFTEGYDNNFYIVTITENSFQKLNVYLNSQTSDEVIFALRDSATGKTIEGGIVAVRRFINGKWEVISSLRSDVSGRVSFSYIKNVRYKFLVSADNFETRDFELNPIIFSTYNIQMNPSTTGTQESPVLAYFTPRNAFNNLVNPFELVISAPEGNLQIYSLNITYKGTEHIETGFNSYGGTLSVPVNISGADFGDRVYVTYTYKVIGEDSVERTHILDIRDGAYKDGSFLAVGEDYGLGFFERAFIITLITILIGGAAFIFGGVVASGVASLLLLGYFIYISFMTAWVLIPSMILIVIIVGWRAIQ